VKGDGTEQLEQGARIHLPEPDAMSPEQRLVFDAVVSGPRGRFVGPLRAAIHSPELADRWQRLGEFLRYRTILPPKLSELAILVTARRWNSELEWGIHARAARAAGLSETVIAALRVGAAPDFDDPAEAEVYAFARELQMTGQVPDDVYAAVLARWQARGAVELAGVIGYYTMVSMTLNVHRIPLPPDVTPEMIGPEGMPEMLTPLERGRTHDHD
jgi:4-carboxymuconolactone decarboxylase